MSTAHIIIVSCKDKTHGSKLIKELTKLNVCAKLVDIVVGDEAAPKEKAPAKLPPCTIGALKEVLTRVKEELGSDVLKNLFVVHDCKKLGDLAEKEYATMYAEAEQLLNPGADEEEMDPFDMLDDDEDDEDDDLLDGLGDDEDEDDDLDLDDSDAPSLEDVKKLASKFSDNLGLEKQREVLGKFGIPTTRSLGKATPEQLTKIHAAFTKGLK